MNLVVGQKVWHIRDDRYKDLVVTRIIDNITIECRGFKKYGEDIDWTSVTIHCSRMMLKSNPPEYYENKPKLSRKNEWYDKLDITRNMRSTVQYMYLDYLEGNLDLHPAYQRDLVWTLSQKQSYLDNLFVGKATISPTIILNKTNNAWKKDCELSEYEVLDGLQRLTTVFDFITNEFPLSNGLYYEDLRPDDSVFILYHDVIYTRLEKIRDDENGGNLTLEEKIKYFLDVNELGTKVSQDHIDKVKSMIGEGMNDSSLIVKGEIAKQIQKEALSEPTEKALERNEKASKLVASLKG